jgi:putative cell wall-binding protein
MKNFNKLKFPLFNFKKFSVKTAAIFTMAAFLLPINVKAAGENNVDFKRLAGQNRYATASAISKEGWKSSKYVIIAQGENFPDALCSVPLAKKYNAPILLTKQNELSKETYEELKRLNPSNIIIIGGKGSISEAQEKYIKDNFKNISLERIGGKDRYETSVKIADKLNFNGSVAFVSSMYFADALSIAPIAAFKGMPILITPKDNLSSYEEQYLKGKNIDKAYIVGGKGVIGESVENKLPKAYRIAGKDRFETNVEIIKNFKNDLNTNNVFISIGKGSKGNEFADALSGAALAAKMNSPMVLSANKLPEVTEKFAKDYLKSEINIYALGGESILPNSEVAKLKHKESQNPSPDKVNKDKNGNSTGSSSSGSSGSSSSGSSSSKDNKDKGDNINKETPKVEDKEAPKVVSAYLKGDKGTLINAKISGNDIDVEIPSDFNEKFIEIVVSASENIESASAMGIVINKEKMDALYGNNRSSIDLITYLRSIGLDKEKDGLGKGSVKFLSGTKIELIDSSKNKSTYTLNVR